MFHREILTRFIAMELQRHYRFMMSVDWSVPGGGTIKYLNPKKIAIFGEALEFGPADHSKTFAIINRKFPWI